MYKFYMQSAHTLILVQWTPRKESRTFFDYKSVDIAAEGKNHRTSRFWK